MYSQHSTVYVLNNKTSTKDDRVRVSSHNGGSLKAFQPLHLLLYSESLILMTGRTQRLGTPTLSTPSLNEPAAKHGPGVVGAAGGIAA